MKECTKEQLDYLLHNYGIRLGTFQLGPRFISFAANCLVEDMYLPYALEIVEFGYENEGGDLLSFAYQGTLYLRYQALRENAVKWTRKNHLKANATDIAGNNEFLHNLKQTDAALSYLAFKAMVGLNADAPCESGLDGILFGASFPQD